MYTPHPNRHQIWHWVLLQRNEHALAHKVTCSGLIQLGMDNKIKSDKMLTQIESIPTLLWTACLNTTQRIQQQSWTG